MDKHALAVLELADSWNLPHTRRLTKSGELSSKFEAITPKLWSELIKESTTLGGTILHQFWKILGECDPQLKINIEELKTTPFQTPAESNDLLFKGTEPAKVDFKPILSMAAEFFTHVGVVFANPGGPKSANGTPYSVSEFVEATTEELLDSLKDGESDGRKQAYLKVLAYRRDGNFCPVTQAAFWQPTDPTAIIPELAHVIPHSIHNKPDTLKSIAMFAGNTMLVKVLEHLNTCGNVMNLESNAHTAYDNLIWGIEATEHNGTAKYIFRSIPKYDKDIGFIRLRDGDEIKLGRGSEGDVLGHGPLPDLCNLRFAVVRVLKMSGAAGLLEQAADEADDSYFPCISVTSSDFYNILSAKLLLSGQALWNTV